MAQFNNKGQRIRAQAGRYAGTAGEYLRYRYESIRAYLMTKPPLQRAALMVAGGIGALIVLMLLYVLILIPLTPSIKDLKQARTAKASTLMSADGKQLASFDEGLHESVKLDKVSPHVLAALVATEDHRFYDHWGIDVKRTVASVAYTAMGESQGGSTITQQLARNLFPDDIGRKRNAHRKLKEMITALKIEATYSKKEILETYLNTVPFLYNTFGIETAARTYFNKPALKLDILESATLVGMLKGTSFYNPVTQPERSKARRNVVLGQMLKHGIIDQKRYDQLIKRPIKLQFSRKAERVGADTHFTAHVRKWLIQWADENDYNLQLDGLVVHTTLDFALQTAAQKAVEKQGAMLQRIADVEWSSAGGSLGAGGASTGGAGGRAFDYFWRSRPNLVNAFVRETGEYRNAVEAGENKDEVLNRLRADSNFMTQLRNAKTRLEVGFVALDPTNGEVKAWVGSREFGKDQFDHVAQAERQPGSTFKAIVYGAALERGIAPNRLYRDEVVGIKAGDGKIWRPTDMHGSSGADMTLADGLILSKNTITAQVMQEVGLPGIVQLARDLGVKDSKLEMVPSLALGTSPVTLLEMVSAYSTIAAQGEYRKPVFVKRITDRKGTLIAEFGGETPQRAMRSESAIQLIDIMRGVINRGTGTAIRHKFGIKADVAGKTGTTQKNTDGWFIMMHPQLVAGAWVGFNDNRVTMRSSYWGQGAHNALLVVGDFYKTAIDSRKLSTAAAFPGVIQSAPLPQDGVIEIYEEGGEMQQEGVEPPPQPYIEEGDIQPEVEDPRPSVENVQPAEIRIERVNEPPPLDAPPPGITLPAPRPRPPPEPLPEPVPEPVEEAED